MACCREGFNLPHEHYDVTTNDDVLMFTTRCACGWYHVWRGGRLHLGEESLRRHIAIRARYAERSGGIQG